jgi:Na+-transporting NADH:ubiquinone oxidoreductase subunit NqrF
MKLSAENAAKLNKRYNGRAITFTQNGRYKGAIHGYLLVVSESGFVYYDEDWCREFFQDWDTFGGFRHISENKSSLYRHYSKDRSGRFTEKSEKNL